MPLNLLDMQEAIQRFFVAGGPVLYLIAGVTFLMWALILERYWYYVINHAKYKKQAIDKWEQIKDHHSPEARAIRRKELSVLRLRIDHNCALIKTLISLCPLFGLLGTVTGMIDVFAIVAITEGGNVKAMASGVSRATIPTMAGMVAALSGVFANIHIARKARREYALAEQRLAMD